MLESIVFLVLGILLGAAIIYFYLNSKIAANNSQSAYLNKSLEETKSELFQERNKVSELSTLLAGAEKDLSHLNEKLNTQKQETENLQKKFSMEFENLANKILDEKSNKFSELNQKNISNILNPLKEKIADFEKKVEDNSKDSISMHASLKEQIRNLTALNEQMSKEANNLTKALKGDSKMQGNWGELILERVLEKSGLEKGREYDVQQSFTTDEGNRVMPDVIIHLPDGKKMIVDSKVSLTAYEKYVGAEDELERAKFLKEHIQSIEKHVVGLGSKNYHDLYKMESPDFVLLFIPIEPAFAVAINHDEKLYNKAFAQNIVIVTPSTLLATLRTIDSMWQNKKQQENAMEIADRAGKLYDKFQALTQDLINVGNRLNSTKTEYDNAMNKLSEGKGNLISRVEKLKELGAKANKSIDSKLLDRASDEE